MIIVNKIFSLIEIMENDKLQRLETLCHHNTDTVKRIDVVIHITDVCVDVKVTAEMSNQWGGTTTKRVLWVSSELTDEFVNAVVKYVINWVYDDTHTYYTEPFQKLPHKLVYGKLVPFFHSLFGKFDN